MEQTIAILNFVLALGSVAMAFAAVVLFFDVKNKNAVFNNLINRFGLALAFVTVSMGTIMTLLYSEVFGFVPCGLCWLERVFLYPQVVLLAMALWINDKKIAWYGIGLSIVGMIVSLYHHYIQMGGVSVVGCPTSGAGADCAKRILFEFGFMTFPLMAACIFLFLCGLYYYILKTDVR
jgi:disulfide bond formation protein DsbB